MPFAIGVQHNSAENRVFYIFDEPTKIVTSFYDDLASNIPKEGYALQALPITSLPENSKDNELYIAVGNRVLSHLLEMNTDSPILAIFISRVAYNQVMRAHHNPKGGAAVSAIFSDPSPQHQLFLVNALFKGAPKTSVILTRKTAFLKSELETAAGRADLPLHISMQTEPVNVSKALHDIRDAEVLFALPDSSVYNMDSIQRIILSAYRRNQSIIGFSREFVNAGGLATVYSDTSHIQNEVIRALNHYFNVGYLEPPAYPEQFDIEINERVAGSYDLILPDNQVIKKRIIQSLEACCEK
jgi:ABC-type uncharacterized transport system substrate-binding protein